MLHGASALADDVSVHNEAIRSTIFPKTISEQSVKQGDHINKMSEVSKKLVITGLLLLF